MIQNQVYVFLWSIVTGGLLALIFDFFRAARKCGKDNLLIVCLQDILYLIIAAFVIIMSSFITNDGDLRGYMFLGYLLGVIFYLLLFSKFILNILSGIFGILHNVVGATFDLPKKLISKVNFKRNKLQNEKT